MSDKITNSLRRKFEWTKIIDEDTTADTNFDKHVDVSLPSGTSEIMMTLMRKSNGRTFASAVCPMPQFNGGALYVMGSFNLFSGAINSQTATTVNAVAISDSTGIEIAVNALNEAIKVRIYIR